VIEELLPGSVQAVEAFQDPPELALLPAEAALVAQAVDKRRREFGTVRVCARAALAALGVTAGPILPGERGAPSWPDGIVGSMTHCAGYRAAAVSLARDTHTIGIDAEPNEPLPAGVLGAVTLPAERIWLAELARQRPEVCWDRLVFSAKESVYKAWFPLTRSWLDFEQAEITVQPAERRFLARLLVPGPILDGRPTDQFAGRWLVRDGLIVTAIAITRQPAISAAESDRQPAISAE
jgi:4'-phosphopantetheinyl transferase EntD